MTTVDKSFHDAAYARGVRDGAAGNYSPPKEDLLTDLVFAPINALTGDSSTRDVAESTRGSYNAGHSAGASSRRS